MNSKVSLIKISVVVSISILLTITAIFLIFAWAGGHFDSYDAFFKYVNSFGAWGHTILFLIQCFQVVLPILPGFLGCIVGAGIFGPVVGFIINYLGISLGSIAAYFLARKYGIQLVNKMVKMKKYERYIERIRKSKSYSLFLFLAILLPLAPDDFLCYFSGLIDMPPKKFVAIIILSKPWCILFYSIFFAYFV